MTVEDGRVVELDLCTASGRELKVLDRAIGRCGALRKLDLIFTEVEELLSRARPGERRSLADIHL